MIAVTTQRLGGRGLDFNFIGTVILMRMPESEKLFHSCIGRTGRLGFEGVVKIIYDERHDLA